MKPVVRASLEAPGGMLCVDLLQWAGEFGYAEFRRDPEDGHGWRPVSGPVRGFASAAGAEAAARRDVGWLEGTA